MNRRPARVNVCFHGVGDPERTLDPGEDRYWITTDSFRRILDVLVDRPEVRISFDDSNASDLEVGLPELRQRDLRATYFVIAGRLGSPGSLDEDALRELTRSGMAVGNHGMTHCSWRGMDAPTARRELDEARQQLADLVGTPVTEAAAPMGQYDRTALQQLRALGYRHVHTSDRRHGDPDAWMQPRFSVQVGDTAETIKRDVLAALPVGRRIERAATVLAKRLR